MQFDTFSYGRRHCVAVQICWLLTCVAALLLVLPATDTHAVEMTSLYTVEVALDPEDPDARDTAYRTALTTVLVRLTGTTAAAVSPELAELFPNPARYVLQYRLLPDNELVVSLDGPAIERLLRQIGATIWDSDRPLTLVLLGIDWGQGDREIVAADDDERTPGDARTIDRNRLLRERVLEVGDLRGLPLVFPLLDSQDLETLSFTDIWGGFDDRLLEAAARYGANSVLVGRIRPDSMLEHRWTWYHLEQRRDWSGEPEQAINMLADSMAAQYAVGGDTALETFRLTISGISSVFAYGEVQRFMDSLKAVDKVAVKSASPESITYEVTVQGGAERLGRALQLSGFLDPVYSGNSATGNGTSRLDNDPFAEGDISFREPIILEYLYRSD